MSLKSIIAAGEGKTTTQESVAAMLPALAAALKEAKADPAKLDALIEEAEHPDSAEAVHNAVVANTDAA